MRKQLQDLLEKRVQQCVSYSRDTVNICEKTMKKRESLNRRKGEIIKVKAKGYIEQIKAAADEMAQIMYRVHFQYFIQQKNHLYMEEEVEMREAEFYNGVFVREQEINPFLSTASYNNLTSAANAEKQEAEEDRLYFRYNRLKAVQYAERWWNSYNPVYKKFDVDCTNYISQCLRAGDAPMRGYPNRGKGWWMRSNNWSFSWAVANSLRLYLSNSIQGLQAKEVTSPDKLLLGDVICYDFQGDGRYDHNTIVTGQDAFGMPLVNAHTFNSRMRYWNYEDSTAYTPKIKYKFFTVVDHD